MDKEIILYTVGCPRCEVLKNKLNDKKINFSIVQDVDVMKELGLDEIPVLKVNGKLLQFADANKWINEQ